MGFQTHKGRQGRQGLGEDVKPHPSRRCSSFNHYTYTHSDKFSIANYTTWTQKRTTKRLNSEYSHTDLAGETGRRI